MKRKLISLIIISLLSFEGISQNFVYPNMTLFHASYGNNFELRYDETLLLTTAPHYKSWETIQDRVCFASNTSPEMEVVLRMDCSNAPGPIKVRGVSPDGYDFPEQTVSATPISSTEYEFTYPMTASGSVFPANVVDIFDPFTVGWDFSIDGGTTWTNVDSTKNHLYVTYDAPLPETSNFKRYYSVVDIACRGAVGAATEADVIAGIWSEYSDQNVTNYLGVELTYYLIWNASCSTTGVLLQDYDGHCFAFLKLFLENIKMQGIVKTNNYVSVATEGNTVCGDVVNTFFVNDWLFGTPTGAAYCPAFPYENTATGSVYSASYDAYEFDSEDVTDLNGVPGQNTINPASWFGGHGIALIDGVYYDPSYGLTYTSMDDMEATAIAGYCIIHSISGVTYYQLTDDLTQSSLVEVITTY